eukprot:TRINITY_DN2290_c0_g1_i4.p1 TRINITY_DN2290_c0_g1~~TRINITY_DN2290_c0_g1_i4.p1  ORF type:complete len:275 (+),score=29.82 TRINITY_DN2290_c0_g1_i4:121-945(+)
MVKFLFRGEFPPVPHLLTTLELFRQVRLHPELTTQGPPLQQAITRYASYIEAAATSGDYGCIDLPLDVAWVWFVHCSHPLSYRDDCGRAFGAIVPYHKSAPLYPTQKTLSPAFSPHRQILDYRGKFIPSIDLQDKCVRHAYYMAEALPFSPDDRVTLGFISSRYMKFLKLTYKYGSKQMLVPTKGINLVWQTHMMAPEAYQKDCTKFFKGRPPLLDHTYDPVGRPAPPSAMAATAKLWMKRYNCEYKDPERHVHVSFVKSFLGYMGEQAGTGSN